MEIMEEDFDAISDSRYSCLHFGAVFNPERVSNRYTTIEFVIEKRRITVDNEYEIVEGETTAVQEMNFRYDLRDFTTLEYSTKIIYDIIIHDINIFPETFKILELELPRFLTVSAKKGLDMGFSALFFDVHIHLNEILSPISSPIERRILERIVMAARDEEDNSVIKALPASEHFVNNLELKIMHESEIVQYCVICMEETMEGETITQLPCKHTFHGHCIKNWLKQNSTCPTCRFCLPV